MSSQIFVKTFVKLRLLPLRIARQGSSTVPALVLPDPGEPFELVCEASGFGICNRQKAFKERKPSSGKGLQRGFLK